MENDTDYTFRCVCGKGFIGEYCETGEVTYTNDFCDKKYVKTLLVLIYMNVVIVFLLSAAKSCKDIYETHK